ncbi:acyltransferase [Flavobacteriaceae bacterium XHP0103]|uniref:acyltransferase family protein n=1 Tax=Marixanthotalea marina TaxID=2844359 RepID=UPI002989FFA9|nr:acyltransferase [Marixanthotalea marina]MBU3821386.1 acyltransferase [Marixanthotalea marina]
MKINIEHRIFGLDVVRAIAILLVLFSHSTLLLFPNEETLTLNGIRFLGTIGVDLFFVLSGFLIGGIILKQLEKGRTAFKDFGYFWVRRWFRTLPNYYLVLFINILLYFLFYGKIVPDVWRFFVFIQNFSEGQIDFFTESWSLSIEEFSYVLGPLLLYVFLLLFKYKSKHKLFLLVTILIIISSLFIRYGFHQSTLLESNQMWSKELRKVVVYRLDSIYYGFLAAYVALYFQSLWKRFKIWSFCLGLSGFLILHIVIFSFEISPVNAPQFFNVWYLPLLSITLLLFFPLASQIKTGTVLSVPITKISVLSYAMYLLNYSIILLTIQYFIDVQSVSFLIKALLLILFWVLTYYASYFLFVYFEKPMTNLRESRFIKAIFNQ